MSKSQHSPEQRAMIAQEYLDGKGSSYEIGRNYNINPRTVQRWAKKYEQHGLNVFIRTIGNANYTSEFKQRCVKIYISGEMSQDEIVAKYNIPSDHTLRRWILQYNTNRELKDYIPKREVYMAESRRKTTLEERKEIVAYCLEHNRDYKNTASVFEVSYSQVYSWVKKNDATGEEGLTDKRGRHKTDDEVDELERLRRENKRLKHQLEENDMLVQLLKKVKEFEGM